MVDGLDGFLVCFQIFENIILLHFVPIDNIVDNQKLVCLTPDCDVDSNITSCSVEAGLGKNLVFAGMLFCFKDPVMIFSVGAKLLHDGIRLRG